MSYPYSPAELDAITRLASYYNGTRYNSTTNPGGMAAGGHRTNFIPSLQDLALVAEAVSDAAGAADTSADAAAQSAIDAAAAAAATGIITSATPPVDTSKLWKNTVDGKLYNYNTVLAQWVAIEGNGPATEGAAGIAEIATVSETATGTDDARIVTPAKLRAVALLQGKHAVWMPAGAMAPRRTNGCGAFETVEIAAAQPNVQCLPFDATTAEFAQFSIQMPTSWDEGTIEAVFVWSHPATTTNFGVAWRIAGVAVGDNEDIGVAFGTAVTVTDAGGTTNRKYTTAVSAPFTVAGSPQPGDTVFFEVSRNPADAADTMAVDARLIGVYLLVRFNAANEGA